MYRLRELERKDLKNINEWRNNADLIRLLGAPFRYINREVDESWYDSYMSNRGNAIRCSIIREEDGENVGLVSLTDIDFLNRTAELHIMIGKGENQNAGAGTYALKEMLNHGFMNMNLKRIELTVLKDNKRAIHLYEKAGFVREGEKRSVCYKEGQYKNMYLYGLLRDEYKSGGGYGMYSELLP